MFELLLLVYELLLLLLLFPLLYVTSAFPFELLLFFTVLAELFVCCPGATLLYWLLPPYCAVLFCTFSFLSAGATFI